MAKFRIVRDEYAGFEVQHKYRWWPFWIQTGCVNTHSTMEAAEEFAGKSAQCVVKYLGELTPTTES